MSSLEKEAIVRVIASNENWVEGNAVQKLEQTLQLKSITRAVGMSD